MDLARYLVSVTAGTDSGRVLVSGVPGKLIRVQRILISTMPLSIDYLMYISAAGAPGTIVLFYLPQTGGVVLNLEGPIVAQTIGGDLETNLAPAPPLAPDVEYAASVYYDYIDA